MVRPRAIGHVGMLVLLALIALGTTAALSARMQRATDAARAEKLPDGVRVQTKDGFLSLRAISDSIVRVTFSPTREFTGDPMTVLAAAASAPASTTTVEEGAGRAALSTAKLRVTVGPDSAVTFADRNGRTILAETPGGRTVEAATVQGEPTHHVRQAWQTGVDESLYGLGQRQEGTLDIKGFDFDLWQRNTVVYVPMIVSSRGYGLLWDNTSPSKFGDIRPFEAIPALQLVDMSGKPGGLSEGTFASGAAEVTATTTAANLSFNITGAEVGPLARGWQGQIAVPVTGDYQFQTYSNGHTIVSLAGKTEIDHYKQNWATEYDQFKVHLVAGRRYPFKITNRLGTTLRLTWKTPSPKPMTSMWSESGNGIDYYFLYGPEIDGVIGGYRALTGRASMLPDWAFGLWQSKNKYNTQAEILRTLEELRRRQIPVDTIVQDWQYWPPDRWGDHEFEASRYPDPTAMISSIHAQHARFMVSVWGKFYPVTENYKALKAIGGLYLTTINDRTRDWLNHEYAFYDVFSAPARKMFWDQVNRALFQKGVDAWWMDATEPDLVQPSPPTLDQLRRDIDKTAMGSASAVMQAYPLMNSAAVYEGQRSVAPDQRVFILTRSGFAGIQRYATVTWSGDITSTFQTLRKQIAAGLGFSISGTPYWTTDTGGYTMEPRLARAVSGDALDEWRELNARWFQYSTFCPILRLHGTDRPREFWNIGDERTPVYQTLMKFDKLRYALFPYIYSLAANVTQHDSTIMRPLVMDFRSDAGARTIADQYMFGPAFLVNPVTEYKARSRSVYLPARTTWYDFWSGRRVDGGQTITADAPFDRLPLFVRAGSIVPVGPDQQYIGEKPRESVTIYVYAGADGSFALYEDDGRTYGYERNEFSVVPLSWNEQSKTLTIGDTVNRPSSTHEFKVVLVSPSSAQGYAGIEAPGKVVKYDGKAVRITF
jgi:alpha-D-xyloside xylohydrolase